MTSIRKRVVRRKAVHHRITTVAPKHNAKKRSPVQLHIPSEDHGGISLPALEFQHRNPPTIDAFSLLAATDTRPARGKYAWPPFDMRCWLREHQRQRFVRRLLDQLKQHGGFTVRQMERIQSAMLEE